MTPYPPGGLAQTSPFEVCDAPEGQSKGSHGALGSSHDRSLREIADSTERSLRQPAVDRKLERIAALADRRLSPKSAGPPSRSVTF